jgi:hypothetical protein
MFALPLDGTGCITTSVSFCKFGFGIDDFAGAGVGCFWLEVALLLLLFLTPLLLLLLLLLFLACLESSAASDESRPPSPSN